MAPQRCEACPYQRAVLHARQTTRTRLCQYMRLLLFKLSKLCSFNIFHPFEWICPYTFSANDHLGLIASKYARSLLAEKHHGHKTKRRKREGVGAKECSNRTDQLHAETKQKKGGSRASTPRSPHNTCRSVDGTGKIMDCHVKLRTSWIVQNCSDTCKPANAADFLTYQSNDYQQHH